MNLFVNPIFPPGSNMPPLPPVIYLTIVPTIYIYAILTHGHGQAQEEVSAPRTRWALALRSCAARATQRGIYNRRA